MYKSQSFSERERRLKVQEWARAREHPKSAERKRKLALIFALKIIKYFRKSMEKIQIFYYLFLNISSILWNGSQKLKKCINLCLKLLKKY